VVDYRTVCMWIVLHACILRGHVYLSTYFLLSNNLVAFTNIFYGVSTLNDDGDKCGHFHSSPLYCVLFIRHTANFITFLTCLRIWIVGSDPHLSLLSCKGRGPTMICCAIWWIPWLVWLECRDLWCLNEVKSQIGLQFHRRKLYCTALYFEIIIFVLVNYNSGSG
jgi:hypothetical protein